MANLNKALLACLSILFAAGAFLSAHAESPGGSGGGRVVICQKNHRKTAVLLDLYEARILYNHPTLKDSRPMLQQATSAFISFLADTPNFYGEDGLAAFAKDTFKQIQLVEDASLKEIPDSNEIITPEQGCHIQQLANYSPQGIIFVGAQAWKLMDETNRAALITHEFFYHIAKTRAGALTSEQVRRRVGLIFGGYRFGMPRVKPNGTHICTGKDTLVYIYPEDGTLTLEPVLLGGKSFFGGANLRGAFFAIPLDKLLDGRLDPNMTWTHWELVGPGADGALINFGYVQSLRDLPEGADFKFKIDSYPERTNRDPETEVVCKPMN